MTVKEENGLLHIKQVRYFTVLNMLGFLEDYIHINIPMSQ